ncbi:MAG: CHASE2 domain-containing protein [Candidatus Omnitrophota bacterium]
MDFSKLKTKITLYVAIFFIALSPLLLSYFRVLDNYELETLDIRFRLRPQLPIDGNIVIIEIEDYTIDEFGEWPLSRIFHASLIDILTEAGAKIIFFDVFFSEESELEADLKLQTAIEKSGKVYLPHVFDIQQKDKRGIPVAEKFQESILDRFVRFVRGAGYINIIPDSDGKYRRVPPLVRFRDAFYPHMSVMLYADYLGIDRNDIKIKPGHYLDIGNDLRVPLDENSNIIVNFPGRWVDTYRHYAYVDIIKSYISTKFPDTIDEPPIIDLEELKGSVCFVGLTGTATPDAHPTPIDSIYPGVGVHAGLFNSFLQKNFVRRATRWSNVLILAVLCFIAYLISRSTRTLFSFLFVFFFIIVYIILAGALFFLWGLWVDIFCPIIVMFLVYLGTTFLKFITETHKREVMEKELSIAKKIQQSFLPKANPKAEGTDIGVQMSTALQVGGDLYDYVEMEDGRLGLMIGDVSGKGVPAALYMAKVVSEFKFYAREEKASETILKLNDRLCADSGSGLFVTLSYMIFDKKTNMLSYSTGGHLPLIMVRKGEEEPRLVDLKEGMPLGLFEGIFLEEKIELKSGDTLVLYTDGVTEAMNAREEMFGEERLVKLIKDNRGLNAEALVKIIQKEVKIFEGKKQHDDITVMVFRRT